VSHYLAATSSSSTNPLSIDPTARTKLLQHLGSCIRQIDGRSTSVLQPAPDSSPSASASQCYNNVYTPPASPHHQGPVSPSATHVLVVAKTKAPHPPMWRPW
jgi:hypothetical protein